MNPTVESHVVEIAGPGQVRFRDETLVLEGLGGREVACETLYSAVSPGTELAAYEGLTPLRPDRTHSRVVGYCNLARVLAVGDWVRRYRAGDLVLTLQSHRSHFVCPDDEILLALPPGDHGDEDLARAATTYLFHQGYSALLRGDLKPGQYLAVVGLGTLGLATVAVAARFGTRAVGLSEVEASRELAARFGALETYPKEDAAELGRRLDHITRGTGVDIVVLTSGDWEDFRLATLLARPGGKVCVLGFPGRRVPIPPFNPLEPTLFYRKQLSYLACGYTPDVDIDPRDLRFTIRRNCAYLLDLVLAGDLPADALISAVEPWHRIQSVYDRIAAREEGFLTAVLRWAGEEPPAGFELGATEEVSDGRA